MKIKTNFQVPFLKNILPTQLKLARLNKTGITFYSPYDHKVERTRKIENYKVILNKWNIITFWHSLSKELIHKERIKNIARASQIMKEKIVKQQGFMKEKTQSISSRLLNLFTKPEMRNRSFWQEEKRHFCCWTKRTIRCCWSWYRSFSCHKGKKKTCPPYHYGISVEFFIMSQSWNRNLEIHPHKRQFWLVMSLWEISSKIQQKQPNILLKILMHPIKTSIISAEKQEAERNYLQFPIYWNLMMIRQV